jgi:hypothetical protein
VINVVLAYLLYPGLVFTFVLAVAFSTLLEQRFVLHPIHISACIRSVDGVVGTISLLLSALALVLLPWPLHPASHWSWIGNPLALWATIEGAFLLPVLIGQFSSSPLAMRAASREAQMGIAGRCVVWLALGTALWYRPEWATALLPGRGLLLLAGILALPAAIGFGPFGVERSLSAAGVEEGLDESTTSLLRFVRTTRASMLLIALIVASVARAPIQPWIALLLIAAMFVVVVLLLRQIAAALPRFTLPGGLHWCWWRALPFAIIGIVYFIVV